MNSERPMADAPRQSPAATQPAISPSGCYIAASAMAEVMFDQLQYLLDHTGQHCAPECMDCGRMQQVKNWLLLPFHSAMHPPVQ